MIDQIIDPLLDELSSENRKVIEAFLENVNQRLLENGGPDKTEKPFPNLSTDYEGDENLGDYIVVLTDQDEMDLGAPCPIILADEHRVAISFYLHTGDETDKSAVFLIDGVSSFEQASNVGGYDHDCAFPPKGYGNVWKRPMVEGRQELVFGFHDTSFRTECSEYSYSVHASDDAMDRVSGFIFGEG